LFGSVINVGSLRFFDVEATAAIMMLLWFCFLE